jgi:hypothetical protein
VVVADLNLPNTGMAALYIPVAGSHTLKIAVNTGMAQGWVTLYKGQGSSPAYVTQLSCTSSGSFTTCQNSTTVSLTTTDQYQWDFHMVSLPSYSETIGGEVTLTRP